MPTYKEETGGNGAGHRDATGRGTRFQTAGRRPRDLNVATMQQRLAYVIVGFTEAQYMRIV